MIRKRIIKANLIKGDNPIYGSVYSKDNKKNQVNNPNRVKKHYYTHGDLGFDKYKMEYIAHLIRRYNEYKKKEIGKENMNFNLFESILKKKYNIIDKNKSLYHLPVEQFEELAEYIQTRISSTKFAVTLGRDHKNFSTYEDYLKRQTQ